MLLPYLTPPPPQDEWHVAATREDERLRARVAVLRAAAEHQAEAVRSPATRCFDALEELADQRYRAEVAGVDRLCSEARCAVEAGTPILREFVLAGATFHVDAAVHTYQPVPRPRPTSPHETAAPATFTIRQLQTLATHLRTLAPSGVAAVADIVELLTALQLMPGCGGALPPAWVLAAPAAIRAAVEAAAGGSGWLDWRWLVVDACTLPPPPPGALEHAARVLRARYPSGVVTGAEWRELPLWFDTPAPPPDAVTLQRSYHRSARVRELLFDMFAPPALTYYGREMAYEPLLLTLARAPVSLGGTAGARCAVRVLLALGRSEVSGVAGAAGTETLPCPLPVLAQLVKHVCPKPDGVVSEDEEAPVSVATAAATPAGRAPGEVAVTLEALLHSPAELKAFAVAAVAPSAAAGAGGATLHSTATAGTNADANADSADVNADTNTDAAADGAAVLTFEALFETRSPLPGPLQQLLQRCQAVDPTLGLVTHTAAAESDE